MKTIADTYGENVFNLKTMKNYLSEKAYKSLLKTTRLGDTIDPSIADEVADAMKNWAVSKGATHFTHWFQPLTGTTAEKHDSFISPDDEGGVIFKFSGAELIKGEPDASSFPSGGLRATFEARGYTAWDPTSPAFIKESDNGATLCIPTAFYSYTGEALDKKTPLLRSISALSLQLDKLAKLFGIKAKDRRGYATLGAEQEYFLIDKRYYDARLDLVQTGRTLFGKAPAKHQQMEDHYFGAIKLRIMNFMEDLDRELWRLGIPAKTRHNEVCPAQFEIAPVFEELNLAVDHNMITMETIKSVAEKHGLVALLHEKPFAGVNGSGKHNNWAICGPDGKNWLTPGDNPHENAKFLTIICALMQAVDTHAEFLRASVASAGNDHRLGANEAPPAILSIFLGEQLFDIITQIEQGKVHSSKKYQTLELGVTSLPQLPRDVTDRNRTSPFAFTGNKFEFRAVGSNQSCAGANIVLNTIVAEAMDDICSKIEKEMAKGKKLNDALSVVLQGVVKKHKRILFDGDGYSDKWHKEAEKRGLPNLKTTPEAVNTMDRSDAVKLFAKHKVLSEAELKSRNEIYRHQYQSTVLIEAKVSVNMAKTMIVPVAIEYQGILAESINAVKGMGTQTSAKGLLRELMDEIEKTLKGIKNLEKAIDAENVEKMLIGQIKLREAVDTLEGIVPADMWPLPSYAEMLFQ
ncbi:MAG: glutamine synthetase III [Candidatus Omnitrophica bacterium]|nr:glutamine synthetase III [Candidatus Omnitrophota bacterium]MDD5080685.1 glutamine synthetase III [Candidatus Omnitrophota bacterium]MDD5440658.1 glutamine synthetase III [Candidatus Omnitrophota bacterium]